MSFQKPVTEYKNSELFEIINHIDRGKYPQRVLELEKEIEKEKARGDIPKDLVPEIDWSDISFEKSAIIFFGILVLGTTLLSLFQFLELFGQETKEPLLVTSGINTTLLFLGSIFLLANKPRFGDTCTPFLYIPNASCFVFWFSEFIDIRNIIWLHFRQQRVFIWIFSWYIRNSSRF